MRRKPPCPAALLCFPRGRNRSNLTGWQSDSGRGLMPMHRAVAAIWADASWPAVCRSRLSTQRIFCAVCARRAPTRLSRTICGRRWARSTFFIALPGYGQPTDRARALPVGFQEHLVKPADLEGVCANSFEPDDGVGGCSVPTGRRAARWDRLAAARLERCDAVSESYWKTQREKMRPGAGKQATTERQ